MDYFHYKNGIYHAEEVSLPALAKEIGTPFYCYSSATLARHYEVFSGHFPGAKICYAVKANGNLAVLKTLAKLGSGADVVSEGEIRLALTAGVAPADIVFSGVGKTKAEMAFALDKDIFQFNVESEPELELLSEIAKTKNKKARVAVRINPDVDPGTHAKIATGHGETKFGVGMEEALPLYKKAMTLPGIEVQGVSVHIGSQLTSLDPFAAAFAHVALFVRELKGQGIGIKTVDLGGGLGIPYGENQPPLPRAYADIVAKEMHGLEAQLIFEPGRVLVGNAGILVTRVLYIKENAGRIFVVTDAGMNDLMRPALYDAHHEIVPVAESKAALVAVDIVGPVCETSDIFARQRKMPLLKAGDLLAIRSAGAYGVSMASNYNARPLVTEVMVNGKDWAVVRPRQSYEEMLGVNRLPKWL